MLRDAGVRTKLLAVLALPTVLLLVVTAILVGGQAAAARRAGQVSVLAEVAAAGNNVVHGLQRERSATLRQLEQPGPVHRAEMLDTRTATDTLVAALDQLVDESSLERATDAVRSSLARSAGAHAELAGARASIDAARFFATETDVFYGKVIRADLELPDRIAGSGTPELAAALQAFAALSSSIEYASHERDLVEVALLAGSLNEAEFAQTSALLAQQRQALLDFQGSAPPAVFSRLDAKLAEADNYEIDQVRRMLPDLLRGQQPDRAASTAWVDAADSRIRAMTASEAGLVADVGNTASATQLGQERRSLILVGVAVLGLGLALMLAVGLARRITRPLRRLTAAAGEIGDELPRMVERMQTPGEGPGVVVEPILVESTDEIGRLAEAFNTVNSVTVQVATEQAALRSSIAGMFVNVARRNQVLLGRQLKELDGMEANEVDPDVLQRLFTLDHLATRMRRNAESLLVLAGIDSTRRLRSALPLSDVIRTAVGEIESYDRIDLSMSEDCDVSGRHALTVAHLLAELLENATHFSNPETRVVVTAALTAYGVDVTVTDNGLGMSDEELAEANRNISSPPVTEIAVSQRLGVFVVGRLAARLGARVAMRRGRASGTVVTVSLPVEILEGLPVQAPPPVQRGATEPVLLEVPELDALVAELPAAENEPETEPETQPEPEPAPVAVLELEPVEPEAEPVAEPRYARAAVDVLPSRTPGRLGRHRGSVPVPAPVPEDALPDVLPDVPDSAPAPVCEAAPALAPAPEPALAPAAVPDPAPALPVRAVPLARRTPGATIAATAALAITPAPPATTRPRDAAEVRGMLAGFRAGVERGRTPLKDAAHHTHPTDPADLPDEQRTDL